MALASQLLSRDPKLQACLVSDLAHIVEGAAGEHVSKTQTALQVLGLAIDGRELRAKRYGPSTASAVLNFKMLRNIINRSYQTKPDNAAQHRVLLHSRIPCAKIRRPKTGGNAMNAVKTAVCLLLPVLAMAPADVCAQSDVPGTKLRRVVSRDAETMVASAAQWRTHEGEAQRQCIQNSIPALELVTPPQHGAVRFVYADLGIPKGSGCINPVYGQAVMYRPDLGFVGKDRFTYHVPSDPTVFEHFGRPAGQWTVFVTVR